MSVTPITPKAAASAGAEAKPGGLTADFDMFLKLLTTQMQNQDPLNPMDSSQYTQQLAQYSAVEQAIQQTALLKDISARLAGGGLDRAATMIGREASFSSHIAGLGPGQPARWHWTHDGVVAGATATIRDSGGAVVRQMAIDPAQPDVRWDGMRDDGTLAQPGAYSLDIHAVDAAGSDLSVEIQSVGLVREVVVEGGETWIGIGGVSLPMADLVRVSQAA